jgi:hypothetical protein
MTTKKKAGKKGNGKANGKRKKRAAEAGDPIIINGGGGMFKVGDIGVTIEFDHNGYGPDTDPTLWNHEDCKLKHIDADEIGVPALDRDLGPNDTVTIKSAKGGQPSDIQVIGGSPLKLKFTRIDYPYKKRIHGGKDFQIGKILINGQPFFESRGGRCHIRVGTFRFQ